MTGYRLSPLAAARLDEIYHYTRDTWGDDQAESYVQGLFDKFSAIARRDVLWKPIAAEFGITGWFCRHEHHFIYWRELDDGWVGIATVMHERMHKVLRLKEEFR